MQRPRLLTEQLICGNCVYIMSFWPSDCIDLTITSPPYDNLRTYKGYTFDFENIAKQLYRITKPGGVVVWVVGDATIKGSETGTSFKQALYFKEVGFNLHDTMIYEKNSMSYPSSNRYTQIFEYMFIFSKSKPKTINLIKDKKNKWAGHSNWGNPSQRNKNGELISSPKRVVNELGIRNNIWRFNTGKGFSASDKIAHQHPAIFPEQLAKDHIISWSNPGDFVLDPMCGSGTTCKMTKQLNRKYIGIDISQEYIELAQKRLENTERGNQ